MVASAIPSAAAAVTVVTAVVVAVAAAVVVVVVVVDGYDDDDDDDLVGRLDLVDLVSDCCAGLVVDTAVVFAVAA